jgi:glycosyltransferase involved in cell wall biosynthesis
MPKLPRATGSDAVKFSFVVPTFNEGRYIERCIDSIRSNMANLGAYDLLIVDNGSTDDTLAIAERLGVRTMSVDNSKTISEVRNIGAAQTDGDVLIFIDGDVYLQDDWHQHIEPVAERVQTSRLIAGSVYAVDPNASWVAKVWFEPWRSKQEGIDFINGGHLLISRAFFEALSGFDPALETGEDHDICMRAWAAGGEVSNIPEIVSVHLGYPNTLGHFFRRERWHGKGNFSPARKILASKIPLITLTQLGALLLSVLLAFTYGSLTPFVLYLVVAGGIALASAIKWLGGLKMGLLPCAFLSWLYFTARGFSAIDVLIESATRKNPESADSSAQSS